MSKCLMFYILMILILISHLPVNGQIDENFRENQKKALAADSAEECLSYLKFCNEVLRVVPNHPEINYLAARLNEQLGNRDVAIKFLKKAAKLGCTSRRQSRSFVHPLNDPVFSALREKKEFKEIIEIMKISDKPIHKSQTAFTVSDKRLGYFEGITYDPVEKMFYLGSDNKIVKVDFFGNTIGFTREKEQDGLGWVNGVHVDPARRTLWACSNDNNGDIAAIFKYELSSLKLIKKYAAPSDGSGHMFNDLVFHPNGDVYISDSAGALYMIPYSSDTLELFFKNKSFLSPNGITLSENGRVLFSATSTGICKIDIKTKSFARLTQEQGFHTYGIDGLYFKNNSLYVIQCASYFMDLTQVSRFSLNRDAAHITGCEIIEKNTPDLNEPSTGVFADDYFYFIAGSNDKGIIVMKAPLNK